MPAKPAPAVSVSLPTSNAFAALANDADLEEHFALALRLVDAVLDHDDQLVRKLVVDERVDCWVQDQQGWTALHAAACPFISLLVLFELMNVVDDVT